MTKAKVLEMFSKVQILNGSDGIHFIVNERRNKVNQAYLQLKTERDLREAQKYNNTYIDPVYIESNFVHSNEMISILCDDFGFFSSVLSSH